MDSDQVFRREELIRRVESGQLSKEAAEQTARNEGIDALLPQPDLSLFDPMVLDRWSLLMALVWVLVRNPVAVRNSWNEFRGSQWEWRNLIPGVNSSPLRARVKLPQWVHSISTHERITAYAFHNTPVPSFAQALHLLWQAFRNGEVRSYGRDLRGNGDVVEIPSLNWDALEIGPRSEQQKTPFPPLPDAPQSEDALHFGDHAPVYVSVTVKREDLLAAFPAVGDSSPMTDSLMADPVRLLALEPHITPTERKRRIRLAAMKAAYPDGNPSPGVRVKERDARVDEEVRKFDADIETDDRAWRALWKELRTGG